MCLCLCVCLSPYLSPRWDPGGGLTKRHCGALKLVPSFQTSPQARTSVSFSVKWGDCIPAVRDEEVLRCGTED